ncbi:MAG: germination protein YpeB [Alkaliphilus sp.]|nr:MAG: germination protein YpeB [Alkaliphilus sp.]
MKKNIAIFVLTIIILIAVGWGYYQYNEKNDYHTYLDIQFQRQFYDLIGHVENLQVNLAKAMVSGSNQDMIKFLNSAVKQAYLAQEKLTQLPFNHARIRNTERFLSQIGDYSTAMINRSIRGYTLDEKDSKTMLELHEFANFLSKQLIELQQQIVKDGVNFGDLRREGNNRLELVDKHMKDMNLINIEERMQEYPELIYDGPFSAHLKDIKPRIKGRKIDENEAMRISMSILKDQEIRSIKVLSEIHNTAIEGFYLVGDLYAEDAEHEVSFAVSKVGGKMIWYLNNREIGESKLDKNEATRAASEFLEKKELRNMTPTYMMAYEGQAVINFAYEQDGVIIYPDLIKVKIALDNGEVIGFEAEGFLINHHKRNIPKPKLSEEEARERLSETAKVERGRLAIIPTAGNEEVLCYEFKVKFGKDNYLVYINANTGQQEKILLMVQQEDGTLVM